MIWIWKALPNSLQMFTFFWSWVMGDLGFRVRSRLFVMALCLTGQTELDPLWGRDRTFCLVPDLDPNHLYRLKLRIGTSAQMSSQLTDIE